ncbi:BLUE COPPER PROTEIN [Salix viminalis]|uniref:BLUE COPPER PROTEIN n=1 Tax=Salix viminalis TaxID=40686 RepID=A0A9Q0NTJ1_SALVM|nr:BLUE COPPER PROTEIN [Salix viminalis]
MANIASALLIILLAAPAAYAATTYTVGDTNGWTTSGDYTTWASDKTFTVGDSLLFNYGFTHSVAEVSKGDYDSCSTSNLVKTYTGGSSTITLSAAGPMYFHLLHVWSLWQRHEVSNHRRRSQYWHPKYPHHTCHPIGRWFNHSINSIWLVITYNPINLNHITTTTVQ